MPVSQISMRSCLLLAPAPDEDFPVWGIFHGVRNQVADHLLEQTRIASDGQRAGHHPQRQTGRLRVVRQLVPQAVEQIAIGKSTVSALTAPTSIWLMSSSVFSMPVMAPRASSMRATSCWAFSPTTSLPAGPEAARAFARAVANHGWPLQESAI